MSRRSLATPKEVSEFLSVPEVTLKRWRYLGTGPTYRKLNHLVRYDWADVEAFAKAGARAA